MDTYYDNNLEIYVHGDNGILKIVTHDVFKYKCTMINDKPCISETTHISKDGLDISASIVCNKHGEPKQAERIDENKIIWIPVEVNDYTIDYDYSDNKSTLTICKIRKLEEETGAAVLERWYYACEEQRLNEKAFETQFNKLANAVKYVYNRAYDYKLKMKNWIAEEKRK